MGVSVVIANGPDQHLLYSNQGLSAHSEIKLHLIGVDRFGVASAGTFALSKSLQDQRGPGINQGFMFTYGQSRFCSFPDDLGSIRKLIFEINLDFSFASIMVASYEGNAPATVDHANTVMLGMAAAMKDKNGALIATLADQAKAQGIALSLFLDGLQELLAKAVQFDSSGNRLDDLADPATRGIQGTLLLPLHPQFAMGSPVSHESPVKAAYWCDNLSSATPVTLSVAQSYSINESTQDTEQVSSSITTTLDSSGSLEFGAVKLSGSGSVQKVGVHSQQSEVTFGSTGGVTATQTVTVAPGTFQVVLVGGGSVRYEQTPMVQAPDGAKLTHTKILQSDGSFTSSQNVTFTPTKKDDAAWIKVGSALAQAHGRDQASDLYSLLASKGCVTPIDDVRQVTVDPGAVFYNNPDRPLGKQWVLPSGRFPVTWGWDKSAKPGDKANAIYLSEGTNLNGPPSKPEPNPWITFDLVTVRASKTDTGEDLWEMTGWSTDVVKY